MLQPNNKKDDLKRGRTTLISGAEIRLAFAQQSCCSKNCMQKLIEGSSSSTSARGGGNGTAAIVPPPFYYRIMTKTRPLTSALFYFVSKLEYRLQIFQLSNSINL